MAYDNSRFTYENVLTGNGYYMQDTSTVSSGVEEMQEKLNLAGFWCGTPDGKFGAHSHEAVCHFQREYNFTANGIVDKDILEKLDEVSAGRNGFRLMPGVHRVYYDETERCFMHNQMVVYNLLKAEGLSNIAIAGVMGNIEAEFGFRTAWTGSGGSVGLCQWLGSRLRKLEAFAAERDEDETSIDLQAAFILAECSAGAYADSGAISCLEMLKNTNIVDTVWKAADYFTALYERCHSWSTWDEVEADPVYATNRFSNVANEYNQRYYLDASKRRGYAAAYLACINSMQ